MSKITDGARKAGEKIGAARTAAEKKIATGKAKASRAYSTSRAKASQAYSGAQAGVKKAGAKAGQQLDDNPLAFLIGGIALGVLVGALLPRTQQETKTLGPTGRRINKAAGNAAKAAKDAGKKKLDKLGISRNAAKKQAETLLKTIGAAAGEAGAAAAKSVRKPAATAGRKPAATAGRKATTPARRKTATKAPARAKPPIPLDS